MKRVVASEALQFDADTPEAWRSRGARRTRSLLGDAVHHGPVAGPRVDPFGQRFVPLEERLTTPRVSVSLAYDRTLRREVIVKSIAKKDLDPQEQARIMTALQSISGVTHRNVVALYDVRVQPEAIFIAMEHVDGQSLTEWMQARDDRSTREVLELMLQAGEGIAAAHRQGIVHGGLHPGNVLINKDGRALVSDFGLRLQELEHNRCYRAPEQRLGREAESRSDQYALCAMLWQALCGWVPSGSSDERLPLTTDILKAWPPEVLVPATVVHALRRGLASAPEDRFPELPQLLRLLSNALSRRRRSNLVAAVSVSAIATAGGSLVVWHSAHAEQCTGAEEQIAVAWSAGHDASVRRAMLATALPYAPDTYIRVQQKLDAYANAWAAIHRHACEATAIRREQSSHVLDLRMGCLQQARVALDVAVGVLASADAGIVERAMDLMSELPALQRCSDVDALRLDVPPPSDPDDARQVASAREWLSKAAALELAGKNGEALVQVAAAQAAISGVRYTPVQVEIFYREGTLLDHQGEYARSLEAFTRALDLALSAGLAELSTSAASRLAYHAAIRAHRPEEGRRLAEIALGVAQSLPQGLALRGDAHSQLGLVHIARGYPRDAQLEFEHAVDLREQAYGTDDLRVISARGNLAMALSMQGQHAAAEAALREVLALRVAALGPEHPRVADTMTSLAVVLANRGEYAEAETLTRQTVELRTAALPFEHPSIAEAHNNLGFLLMRQGRYEAAHDEISQALAHWLRYSPTEREIGLAYENLGLVALHRGDAVRAEAELRRAIEFRVALLGLEHPMVAQSRVHLGRALAGQKRLREAEVELHEGLANARKVFGPDHPSVITAEAALAEVLIELERAAQRQ